MNYVRTIFRPFPTITPARDRQIAVLMLAFWAAATIVQQWGQWAEDLSAVYIAGWLWHTGQGALIYDAPPAFFGGTAASWKPAMEVMGIADQNGFAFVYPPIWAVLTAPLTGVLDAQGFFNAVALVQFPLLAASVWLAGRILKPTTIPWWLWAAMGLVTLSLSVQSYLAIWHNQPTITVGFLILLAFERLNAKRPVAAGAALALAAAIKLTPAAYALIFLLDRQWRATASFAATGAALALLSVVLAGWPAHQGFLASLALAKSVGYLIAINTSLLPAFLAAGSHFGILPSVDPQAMQFVYPSIPGGLVPALAFAALTVIAAFGRVLSPLPGATRRGLGLLALSIVLALFGPLGWLHYYLVPMFLLPGLFGLMPHGTVIGLIALVGVPSLIHVIVLVDVLPWPIADYTWFMCTVWGVILAAIFIAARRLGA